MIVSSQLTKSNDWVVSMPNTDFYYSRSCNSLRAAIAVELAGVDAHKHEISLSKNENRQDWFLKLNSAGTVPLLIDNSGENRLVLTQSGAILEHLIGLFRPDLMPVDDLKPLCSASFCVAIGDIAIHNSISRLLEFEPDCSKFVFDRMLTFIQFAFESVKDSSFLLGDTVTIADFAHLPVIYAREAYLRTNSDCTHIIDWLERMKSDNAVKQAISYAGLQAKFEPPD